MFAFRKACPEISVSWRDWLDSTSLMLVLCELSKRAYNLHMTAGEKKKKESISKLVFHFDSRRSLK